MKATLKMTTPKRVFFHYSEMEDFKSGMWKIVRGRARMKYIDLAADLMRCPDEFKVAMRQAMTEWKNACLSNFSSDAVNKIAFLGHAGCFVATGSPEECTRVAWHTLTKDEQDCANLAAQEVLDEWVAPVGAMQASWQLDLFRGM